MDIHRDMDVSKLEVRPVQDHRDKIATYAKLSSLEKMRHSENSWVSSKVTIIVSLYQVLCLLISWASLSRGRIYWTAMLILEFEA